MNNKLIRILFIFSFLVIIANITSSYEYNNANSYSIMNATLPFQVDFLDINTPVNFTVRYANASNNQVFNDSVASCYLNISSQLIQIPFNASMDAFHVDYHFASANENIPFNYYCNHSENSSYNKASPSNSITVYPPLKIDVYDQTDYTSKENVIEGIPAEFKLAVQNVTGINISPDNITVDECRILYNGTTYPALSLGNAYYVNITFNESGDHSIIAECREGSTWYSSFNKTVVVSKIKPYLEDSGLDFGNTFGFRQSVLLYGNQLFFTPTMPQNRIQVLNISNSSFSTVDTGSFYYNGLLASLDFSLNSLLDVFYAGDDFTGANLFLNPDYSGIANIALLDDFMPSSISQFDSMNDGYIDMLIIGKIPWTSNFKTFFLRHNDSSFNVSQPLPNLNDGMICTADYNQDGFPDIYLGGDNGTDPYSAIYYTNLSGDFTLNTTLDPLKSGSCAYNYFLNSTEPYLFVFGNNGTENQYYFYRNNFTKIDINLPDFSGLTKSDVLIADFDNDGLNDILMCGENNSNKKLYYYKNNVTNYYLQTVLNSSYNTSDCSLSASDYDIDGDLDLALSGVGASNPIKLFTNTLSDYLSNTPPSAVDNESITINYSNRSLFISWNSTTDNETPKSQLSYNIQVEKINGDILLSGRYPVSTHPAQGYRGNMQFKTNFTLQNVSTSDVRIKIQAIDNGLAHSEWSIKEFNDCISPESGDWLIDYDCSLTGNIHSNVNVTLTDGAVFEFSSDVEIGTNTSITIDNGTLSILPTVNVDGNGSLIRYSSGILTFNGTNIRNLNLTIDGPVNFSGIQFENISFQINNKTIADNCSYIDSVFHSTNEFFSNYQVDFIFKDQYDNTLYDVKNYSSDFMSNHNLTAFIINSSNERTDYSYEWNFTKKYYYNNFTSYSPNISGTKVVVLRRTPEPVWDEFQYGLTTNFSSYITGNETMDRLRFSAFDNVNISNAYAIVNFKGSLDLTEMNLTEMLNFSVNTVSVNGTFYSGNARVVLFNISYLNVPVILEDGVVCSDCQINYYSENVSFNVSGFSTYSTHENSDIELLNNSYIPFNTTVNMFFDYYNFSNTSQRIDATCNITAYGITDSPMTFNLSTGYNYTLKYNDSSLIWNETNISISCVGDDSFEALMKNFTVTIIDDGAWLVKEQEYVGVFRGSVVYLGSLFFTGLNQTFPPADVIYSSSPSYMNLYDSSISISDINNDGIKDTVALGNNDDDAPVMYYEINGTRTYLYGLSRGSLTVFDFDNDGDNDIIACGADASSSPATIIYQNELAQNHFRKLEFVKLNHSLPNLKECSISYGDIDLDNRTEFVMQGDISDRVGKGILVEYNGTDFVISRNTSDLFYGESILVDYNRDGYLDLIQTGWNSSLIRNTYVFTNNGSGIALNDTLSNDLPDLLYASPVHGQIKGNNTLVLIGETSDGLISESYIFNGSNFVETKSAYQVQGVKEGSALLYDTDSDNDLDLFLTGAVSSADNEFITEFYTNTQPTQNQPPSTPVINGSYNNLTGILSLNWTQANDDLTPINAVTYNLRVGDQISLTKFYSSEKGTSSNPTQGQMGNQFSRTTAKLNLPNSCFNVSVQSLDSAYVKSNWSDSILVNNHTEICDGYDNDCDGLIDEDWDLDGDGYYNYVTCPFYTDLKQNLSIDLIDCDDTKTGYIIGTGDNAGSFIYSWTGSACQADYSSSVDEATSRSHSSTAVNTNLVPIEDPQTNDEDVTVDIPGEQTKEEQTIKIPSEKSSGLNSFFQEETLQRILTNTYAHQREIVTNNGVTRITEHIKAKAWDLSNITARISIAKSLAETTDEIIEITPFKIVEYDPVIEFHETKLTQYQEVSFSYALKNKNFDPNLIRIEITHNNISEDQKEEFENQKIDTEKVLNITQWYFQEDNETVYNIDIEFDEGQTILYNVSIFQEIPECLIKTIKEELVDSDIEFEIIDPDPMIVWHFDKLLKSDDIQIRIKALANEDCTNKAKTIAVAREIIAVKDNDENLNLMPALLLIAGLFLFFMFVSHYTKEKFHTDRAHILVKKIKRGLKKKHSLHDIRMYLHEHHEDTEAIEEAIDSVSHPIRQFFIKTAIGLESMILFSLILLNILDFMKVLPGDIDFTKKIISWILLALVFNHVGISRILFGRRRPEVDGILLLSFFLLTTKNFVGFARETFIETEFARDLYVYIINHNVQFEMFTFIAGIAGLLAVAVYMAIKRHVHKDSLMGALFVHHQESHHGTIRRFVQIFTAEILFFVIVFNLMFEWLAIAVDAPILVTVLIVTLITLIAKRIHSHYKEKPMDIVESITEAPDHFYEKMIELFHHPKMLPLGLAGMFVLHMITEIGIYVIPYTFGFLDPVYVNILDSKHLPFFSITGSPNLFEFSSAGFNLLTSSQFFIGYMLNIATLAITLIIPIWVWTYSFKHKHMPLSKNSIFNEFTLKDSKAHDVIARIIVYFYPACAIIFLVKTAFIYKPIENGLLAGVDIMTRPINLDGFMYLLLASILTVPVVYFLVRKYGVKIVGAFLAFSTSTLALYDLIYIKSLLIYVAFLAKLLLNWSNGWFIARNVTIIATMFMTGLSLAGMYIISALILIILYFPEKHKRWLFAILPKHIVNAQKHHHIHYAHLHDNHIHGSRVEVVKKNIKSQIEEGHELFIIAEYLRDHGWDWEIIEQAAYELDKSHAFSKDIRFRKHQRHKYHTNLKKLTLWVKKHYPHVSLKHIIEVALKNGWKEDEIKEAVKDLRLRAEDKNILDFL